MINEILSIIDMLIAQTPMTVISDRGNITGQWLPGYAWTKL